MVKPAAATAPLSKNFLLEIFDDISSFFKLLIFFAYFFDLFLLFLFTDSHTIISIK
jgi:hypothetical protein